MISKSQQNKRLTALATEIQGNLESVFEKNQLHADVMLKSVDLKISMQDVQFIFSNGEDPVAFSQHCNSIVRTCDEHLISREAYRQLAAINPKLIREYIIEKHRHKITNSMKLRIPITLFSVECNQSHNDDGCQTNGEDDDLLRLEFTDSQNRNGAFRTIVSLLHTLVPFLVSCDPPVLKNGDTLKLRLSGDGRQVGRSQSHVLMTMCVLNEGEAVLTPNKQYT